MRNKYPGPCYRCGLMVEAGDGHFERFNGSWRTQHASCAIEMRGQPDAAREAHTVSRLTTKAAGTGKPAQNARRALRHRATAKAEAQP